MTLQHGFKHVLARILVALMVCLIGPTVTLAKERPEASGTNDDSVTKILQERRSILKELVNAQLQAYRANEIGFSPVIRTHRQLFSAELELETKPDERVKLIEAFVKTMSDWENIAEQMFKKGGCNRADLLRAVAWRLEAQVQLLREQAK